LGARFVRPGPTDLSSEGSVRDVDRGSTTGGNPFHAGDGWKGRYTCPQGLTDVDLQIVSASSSGTVRAIFAYDFRGVQGSYYLAGTFDGQSRKATFRPEAWIVQPSPGWSMVGMRGVVNLGVCPPTYTGSILDPRCGSFAVAREGPCANAAGFSPVWRAEDDVATAAASLMSVAHVGSRAATGGSSSASTW
jgi:hypothetical protein